MSLPSMVARSGGQLVVRSLVSGDTVYQTAIESSEAPTAAATVMASHPLVGAELLERQLQLLNNSGTVAAPLQMMMPLTVPPVVLPADLPDPEADAIESRTEEELPQCKIRRNYSCNACAFFTQNPRIHLSHLRDVHGEKIVINECKLCLYASRHFQKLVRHMKMVHGCSDDDKSGLTGRRHCNREARKLCLERSIEVPDGPSLKQLKYELQVQEQQLQHNVEAFNRQQQLQQLEQLANRKDNLFSMAFEFQLSLLPPTKTKKEETSRDVAGPSSSDSEEQPQLDYCLTPEALDPSSDVTKYQCKQCTYSSSVRARFKKHVKYHTMPLIRCSFCDFHSPYKWNLDRHTKNHGANGYFKCAVCNFSTNIKQSLTIHELNHHAAPEKEKKPESEQPSEDAKKSPASPLKRTSSPLPELPSICCSHCQQSLPNAMELANHLQQCEPALRNATQLALDRDRDRDKDVAAAEEYRLETGLSYLEEDDDALKKVFKCPHCTFWAATASRFHVHIVGHLNRKPFECSLCSYRSNWSWDITKHIRLKAMRDKSHIQAQVLMNDETGRRNYAKYNQYLTLMKISPEQADVVKMMRCGEMQINTSEQQLVVVQESPEAQVGKEPQLETSAALDLGMSGKPDEEQAPGQVDGEEQPKPKKSKNAKKHLNESQGKQ